MQLISDEQLDILAYSIKKEIHRYHNSQGNIEPMFWIAIPTAADILEALVELKDRRWQETLQKVIETGKLIDKNKE